MKTTKELIEKARLLLKEEQERYRRNSTGFDLLAMANVNQLEMRHSAILADLLNPHGNHGQGIFFLARFLAIAPLKGKATFDLAGHITVVCEKFIGHKTDENGGRIDIYIQDRNGNEIIIENKIYAGDQDNQLVRYHNFSFPATLVYLTLDGRQASRGSAGSLKEDDYISLSYSDHIVNWLDLCAEHNSVKRNTPLYSGLKQYVNTLKNMTSNANHTMNNDLIQYLLADHKRVECAIKISNAIDELTKRIVGEFWGKLFAALKKRRIGFTPYYIGEEKQPAGEKDFIADNEQCKIAGIRITAAHRDGLDYCVVI